MPLIKTSAYGLAALLAANLSLGGCSTTLKPYDLEMPAPPTTQHTELL